MPASKVTDLEAELVSQNQLGTNVGGLEQRKTIRCAQNKLQIIVIFQVILS